MSMCPNCASPMVPLFTSLYCSAECDRREARGGEQFRELVCRDNWRKQGITDAMASWIADMPVSVADLWGAGKITLRFVRADSLCVCAPNVRIPWTNDPRLVPAGLIAQSIEKCGPSWSFVMGQLRRVGLLQP